MILFFCLLTQLVRGWNFLILSKNYEASFPTKSVKSFLLNFFKFVCLSIWSYSFSKIYKLAKFEKLADPNETYPFSQAFLELLICCVGFPKVSTICSVFCCRKLYFFLIFYPYFIFFLCSSNTKDVCTRCCTWTRSS